MYGHRFEASALSDCSEHLLTALRKWTDPLPAHREGLETVGKENMIQEKSTEMKNASAWSHILANKTVGFCCF